MAFQEILDYFKFTIKLANTSDNDQTFKNCLRDLFKWLYWENKTKGLDDIKFIFKKFIVTSILYIKGTERCGLYIHS